MRLLVTRPEPDNARTAAALRALGHEVLLEPLLRIEPTTDADLGAPPWTAVLLTSANAARAVAAHVRRNDLIKLPALAVGDSSAEAARAAGFAEVSSADGDVNDLARLAAACFFDARAPLLYLSGEQRAGDLAGALAAQGPSVRTVAIYRAVAAAELSPAIRTALEEGRIEGVLHFSRRSVESYLDCTRNFAAQALWPTHYCLSAGVAEPLNRVGAPQVRIAAHPDEESLLALVTSHGRPESANMQA